MRTTPGPRLTAGPGVVRVRGPRAVSSRGRHPGYRRLRDEDEVGRACGRRRARSSSAQLGALILAGLAAGAPQVQVGGSRPSRQPEAAKRPCRPSSTGSSGSTSGAPALPRVPKHPHPIGHWVTILDATALALIVAGILFFFIIPALRRVDWSQFWPSSPRLPESEDDETCSSPRGARALRRDLGETAELLDEEGDPRQAVLATAGCGSRRRSAARGGPLAVGDLGRVHCTRPSVRTPSTVAASVPPRPLPRRPLLDLGGAASRPGPRPREALRTSLPRWIESPPGLVAAAP